MTHQLTLEIPDEVYRPLLEKARAAGQSVEAVVQSCLVTLLEGAAPSPPAENSAPGSRLRRWAGAFDSGLTDLAARHHDHLGQALHDALRGKQDDWRRDEPCRSTTGPASKPERSTIFISDGSAPSGTP